MASADLISFPFRLTAAGAVVTRLQDSDDYAAEEIASLLLTRRGERHLVPTFGTDDPVFGEVDMQDLSVAVSTFGPAVEIVDVSVKQVDVARQTVIVSFQRTADLGADTRISSADAEVYQ